MGFGILLNTKSEKNGQFWMIWNPLESNVLKHVRNMPISTYLLWCVFVIFCLTYVDYVKYLFFVFVFLLSQEFMRYCICQDSCFLFRCMRMFHPHLLLAYHFLTVLVVSTGRGTG